MDTGQMHPSPLVSVVIPAFNVAPFIGQALASALSQSHRPLDIIVVDDGSTDDTVAIARAFGPDVRVFQQANAGSAVARNRGMMEARGEYVAFLDADDFWRPGKIEAQLRHLQSCGECVAVYCNKMEVRDGAGESWRGWPADESTTDQVSTDARLSGWVYHELLRDCAVQTSTILIPRETLQRVGMFDAELRKGQDLDFWLRLSQLGPVHMLESVLSAYRVHPAGNSRKNMRTNYHALIIERAVRQFGLSDPSGQSVSSQDIATILARSWESFAASHYVDGSLQSASEGIRKAIAFRPDQLGLRILAAKIRIKGLVPSRIRSVFSYPDSDDRRGTDAP